MRITSVLSLALAAGLAAPAAAQTLLDVASLREIDDAEIRSADGTQIGELEDVLVDSNGKPVAVTVEVRKGFLDLSDDEVVFSFDQLTYENGDYITSLSATEIEALPRYDD